MFSTAAAVFSGPYAVLVRLAIYGLVALSLFGFGWFKGNEHGTQKLDDYVGKQASQAIAVVTKQGSTTEKVVDHYTQVAGKTKTVTQYVTQEVEKYVPTPGVCFDAEFRRLHDAASSSSIPSPTLKPDGALRTSYTLTQRRSDG